jgi:hypothetical protein
MHRKCQPSIEVGCFFIKVALLKAPMHSAESGAQRQFLVLIA